MKSKSVILFLFLASCDSRSGEKAITNSENSLRKYMRDMRFNVNSLSCRIVKFNDAGHELCNSLYHRYCEVNYTDSSNTVRNSTFCCDTSSEQFNDGCYRF